MYGKTRTRSQADYRPEDLPHFGNGFGLTAYGDVGGFGIAAHVDWQITGTLDYALKPWLDVYLGYRSLNVNYPAKGLSASMCI